MTTIVLDTETTGLPHEKRASVIEIGAVALSEEGLEIGSFGVMVSPASALGGWSARAMEINKIPPYILDDAPHYEAVWDVFLGWMSLHSPIESILAYNVSFDQKMMLRTFPMSEHLPWGPCIMKNAANHLGGSRGRISLVNAMKQLRLPRNENGSHRALNDARDAAAVMLAL